MNTKLKAAVAGGLVIFGQQAFALDQTQVDAIIAAVDYAPIVAGIAGIATVVALPLVASRGAGMILGAIRGRG